MSFMSAVKSELDNEYNVSMTENGALGYATCQPLVDMNFRVTSYRNRSEAEIISDYVKALNEDFPLAVAWLFYARDVREGLGERRLFRALIKHLANTHPKLVEQLLNEIAEYGRWDDLLTLLDTAAYDAVVELVVKQLKSDINNMAENKPISLLAKWMPSVNTSSAVTRAQANILIKAMGVSPRNYRKMLSHLRAYLKLVEVSASANEWSEINYSAVPSKANLKYKEAFLKHDKERREAYLASVARGDAKINSSVAFPHDIVHKYNLFNYYSYGNSAALDATLEEMWKALPDNVLNNTLCVADGSGSMYQRMDRKSDVLAIEVANALAIYAGQHCTGEFKDTYITFSHRPQLVKLNGKTLLDNLQLAKAHNEVSDTDIKKVFELILQTALKHQMTQEDLPKNILILSDMEFNSATGYHQPDKRLFDMLANEYKRYGYTLPRLIFWNLCGRTNTIPMIENDAGVALVSGFSINTLNVVMSNARDPWVALAEVLLSERYAKIVEIATKYFEA